MRFIIFKKLIQKFRKHEFNLQNPQVENLFGNARYSYEKYVCKKCGEVLYFHSYKDKRIPFNMSHGCYGNKRMENN